MYKSTSLWGGPGASDDTKENTERKINYMGYQTPRLGFAILLQIAIMEPLASKFKDNVTFEMFY